MTTTTTASQQHIPPPLVKKRGRKKGVSYELANLSSGGCGGRRDTVGKETPWNLNFCSVTKDLVEKSDGSDESDSDFSMSGDSTSISEEEIDDWEEDDELCISDMVGNRIFPIDGLCSELRKNVCCKKCAVKNNH